MVAPQTGILEDGTVRLVVEHDVTSVSITHRTLHGESLEVGVVSVLLDNQHVALADTLQRASVAVAIVPCGFGGLVGDGHTLHRFADERNVGRGEVRAWVVVGLAIASSSSTVGVEYVATIGNQDAVALGGVCTTTVGCLKSLADATVNRYDEVVECLLYLRLHLGLEVDNDILVEHIVGEVCH